MPKGYRHLTYEERCRISALRGSGQLSRAARLLSETFILELLLKLPNLVSN